MPVREEKTAESDERTMPADFTERKGSLICGNRLSRNPGRDNPPGQAFSCISFFGKASLTVEAALILPLLLFAMITMISFMDVYRIQTEHLTNLCQEAVREGIDRYAEGAEGDFTETDSYSFVPLQILFPLPEIPFETKVTVHPWTGSDGLFSDAETDAEPERMVYMTASGSVMHLDPHCSYLDIHIHAVSGNEIDSARNSGGGKYHACERCSRGRPPAEVVYITDNGTSYHNSGACSSLKRTVRLVPESEASGASFCSRCGGRGHDH